MGFLVLVHFIGPYFELLVEKHESKYRNGSKE